MIDGSFIVLAVGAYLAYRAGCWVDDVLTARATDREVGSQDT